METTNIMNRAYMHRSLDSSASTRVPNRSEVVENCDVGSSLSTTIYKQMNLIFGDVASRRPGRVPGAQNSRKNESIHRQVAGVVGT